MPVKRPTIAHFVSPYLFRTGSWIHTQLTHARRTRPIVLAHALEQPERFPFAPVFHPPAQLGPLGRLANRVRYLAGHYDPRLHRPILEREGAVLLHAHLGWAGARALTVARAARLPLVTSFYGRDAGRLPRYPWWRARYRRLFADGTAFFVEGPHLGRTLEALGCPAAKIHVLHLGIDLTRIPFAPRRAEPDDQIEILVSSSLRPKKGVPAAIDAFAGVTRQFPRARLRILGDGPQRAAVVARIRQHGIGDRVTLEGYVGYERHLAALEAAHLFLAPSRTAPGGDSEGGAPVALIEALASGLPVVATRHADIPEVVLDGVCGLLTPEYDDAALTRSLQWMLEHPETWPAMGRAGRRRAEEEFAAARQAAAAEALYLRLAGL